MKLELNHLAGYLPYGLKGQAKFLGKKNIYTISTDNVRSCYSPNNSIKPVLRPLSDLTKEIEVNGKKFVPIEILFEIDNPQHISKGREYYYTESQRFITCSGNWCADDTSINILQIENNNYWKIQKLLEWHFDIYGLIENGLAIDINTLLAQP